MMPTLAWRKAAKFWVGAAGTVTSAVIVSADAPSWLVVANAALVALGVYLVPNEEVDG